jgi:zinc finger HIT domain-containing protein 1
MIQSRAFLYQERAVSCQAVVKAVDVQELTGLIAVPKTQNARRIIQYQRQIKHWLDDEIAQLQQAPPPTTSRAAARAAAQPQSLRRASTMIGMPATPVDATPGPMTPAMPTPTLPGSLREPALQMDDLLSIEKSMPAPLRPAELEALLSAPPLSYAASHAAAPALGGPPQRQFCDNCGYWGKIKCLKCGARICGMECKDAHEATRCLKWA